MKKYVILAEKHDDPTVYTLVQIQGKHAKEIVTKMMIEENMPMLFQWIDSTEYKRMWVMEL